MAIRVQRERLLRMDLPQALGVALLLHLLLLGGGRMFPGLLEPWSATLPEPRPEPDPLQFTFVDLPQEPPEPETPPENAPASDRTRRAASPPPPEPAPESADPFSEGNTSQKVDFAPAQEVSPQPSPPVEEYVPAEDVPPEPASPAEELVPEPKRKPWVWEEEFQQQEPQESEPREPSPSDEEARKAQALRDAMRPFSMRELGQRFDNLGAPPQADFGTISFDTVGVDWGPYARQIVQLIRARWLERIPPAAKLGLAGRSVLSFRIARDGIVSAITLVDGSGTRPLDKAAEFAIEAASPLPPLPPEFAELGKDDVGVTFEFYYNMRVPDR